VLGIQTIENRLTAQYRQEVEQIAVGDVQPLFTGAEDIEAVVPRNIERFLKSQHLTDWGFELKITVTTRDGQVLFPSPYGNLDPSVSPSSPIDRAAANYDILQKGLDVAVEVELPHNRLGSNLLLAGLVLSSLLILYLHVNSGLRKSKIDEQERSEELRRLEDLKNESTEKLQSLEAEHRRLATRFSTAKEELENQRRQTNRNEDEFIQEIEDLEKKLSENIAFQDKQLEQIEALKTEIQSFEKERERVSRLQKRGVEEAKKRFHTLYKRLSFHDRAVEDFVGLSDEFKLKAEEIILQLNENSDQVSIKRKVFTKKSRETVWEVAFGYRGRMYFRRLKDGRIELLTLGTKNTQARNLEFIEKL
jgi:hypothetical protein